MMDFGKALDILKAGGRVARTGWNGKGMWLVLVHGSMKPVTIDMFTAQGAMQPGWLASQADVLAEDWEEVKSWPN